MSLDECKKLLGPNPWVTLGIGTIVGWLFTRGMSFISRPNIQIELGDEGHLLPGTSNEVKFLHVNISNKKRPVLFRFLFGNKTANNARAWINFIDPTTGSEILSINGRWSTTQEPIDYANNQLNIGLILVPSREVIPTGESSDIAVAVKLVNEDSAFAFNNESYLHSWKKPDYELSGKSYYVEVKIVSDGYEWTKVFTLLNPGRSTKYFRLKKKMKK
jgi:hypothetical protein